MTILDSPLLGEFIGFLKSNWGGHASVSQRRRRLEQLVAMVRGVADAAEGRAAQGTSLYRWLLLLRKEAQRGQAVLDATSDDDHSPVLGSAKKFLAGVKALFVCSAEVDRLTDAVEALERLAGPGADLDIFIKVLQLDDAAPMDLDARHGPHQESAFSLDLSQRSYSAAIQPAGAKRKRSASSGGDGDDEAASHGRVLVDRANKQKRRGPACKRWRSKAVAMAKVRRPIERPSLGRPYARKTMQRDFLF